MYRIKVLDRQTDKEVAGMVLYRSNAEDMRKRVITEIEENVTVSDTIVLDFEGITLCESSYADEFVVELQHYIRTRKPVTHMLVVNTNETVLYNIRSAVSEREIRGKRIQILLWKDGALEILGQLEPKLNDAVRLIRQRQHVTAGELSKTEGIEVNNASTRLKKLLDSRIVKREEAFDKHGKYHVYSFPSLL